jgi:tetratricopeptide (TPR) repeat protein
MADAATLLRSAGADDARGMAARAGEEEGLGRWDAAARLYSLAFRASVMDRDLASAVDALRGQARVRRQQHRLEEAEELADLSFVMAERSGLPQAAARALNVRGIIRYEQADWAGAAALYGRALEMALDLGDDELAGLACQNAGVIAHLRGDLFEARTRYLESIGSFVRSGNSAHAMMAYNNLGVASIYQGEWMEAEVYFSRGIEIGERLSQSPMLARLYSNRAHPLIEIGETARARRSLDSAEVAARAVGDLGTLGEVEKFRAMLARCEGRLRDADEGLERARRMATAATAFERAELLRESGHLREAQGRPADARAAYREAARLYSEVGARRQLRLVELRVAALVEHGEQYEDAGREEPGTRPG